MTRRQVTTVHTTIVLLAATFTCALAGCVQNPERLHTRYSELQPNIIHVAPVSNNTLRDDLGGIQSQALLVLGEDSLDVQDTFHKSAKMGLRGLGYRVPEREPEMAGADSDLHIRLHSWSQDHFLDGGTYRCRCSIQLVDRDTGEHLFETEPKIYVRGWRDTHGPVSVRTLREAIHKSVLKSLRDLPATGSSLTGAIPAPASGHHE